MRERTARAAYERGETGQFESMGLALAVADAETLTAGCPAAPRRHRERARARDRRVDRRSAPGLPDPLLLPTATFVVQETAR